MGCRNNLRGLIAQEPHQAKWISCGSSSKSFVVVSVVVSLLDLNPFTTNSGKRKYILKKITLLPNPNI